MSEKDGQASRARAQVERGAHGPAQERLDAFRQDFRDERAWDDDAPVNVKPEIAQPRLVREVSRWNAPGNPSFHQLFKPPHFGRRDLANRIGCRRVRPNSAGVAHKPRRLFAGIPGAVPVGEPAGAETPGNGGNDAAEVLLRRLAAQFDAKATLQ